MNRKNVLLVTEMDFTEQIYEALERLIKEGYFLYLLSDMQFTPKKNIFEKQYTYDICSTLDTFKFIKRQNINFDAVVTKSCELVTPLVALLGREFGCAGNNPKTAFYCRSKYHMRKRLGGHSIPQPHFQLCKNHEEIINAVKKIGIPCVLKPVGGHSSFGTFMVQNGNDIKNITKKYEECRQYLIDQSKTALKQMNEFTAEELAIMDIEDPVNTVTDYLVEEYLEGPEISIDALVQNGHVTIMGIADQIRMKPPYFVQVAEKMPFLAPPELLNNIKKIIEKVIHAMGITDSATHTEIILTKDGPKIVEIACRMGSDNIHDAIYQTTGYNMMYEIVRIALGKPITVKKPLKNKAHYAMEYLLPKKAGILKKIDIPKTVYNDPMVTEIRIDAKKGDFLAPPPKNFDFIGYIGTKGETPALAQQKLKKAMNAIHIITL